MSGIVGIYNRDGQPCQREYLQGMTDAIAHRGPDGCDFWHEGPIGFGHRMLLTTPESLVETLPWAAQSDDECLVITSDARIDNREELLEALQLHHSPEKQVTDSQIILAAYRKWGTTCPEHLIGDFAFAIWDAQHQHLFCARDHLGVKPFYYHASKTSFIFASELKAILTVPGASKAINLHRLADFITMNLDDKVNTTYQNVLRLPPAHWLVMDASGIKTECYWQLDPDYELHLESDEAYAEQFRLLFEEAVRCRLRSAFPIGSQLSGGLDSSSVTTMARSILDKDKALHTFSCLFDDLPSCDERSYIESVLEKGGMTPHYLRGDRIGPLSDIETILDYEDEAFLGPNYYFPWHLNKLTKRKGIRVLLDGHDGDTVVSHGVYRLTELARAHKWEELVSESKSIALRMGSSAEQELFFHASPTLKRLSQQLRWLSLLLACQIFHRELGLSRKRLLWQVVMRPFWQLCKARLWSDSQASYKEPSLLAPEFAQQIQANTQKALTSKSKRTDDFPKTVREQHWKALDAGIFTYVAEQIDRAAAAFSFEARHPFLDKRLVEFCLALPSKQKMTQGWGRLIMRQAMIGLLPERIQWRGRKTDLTPNFSHGLLKWNRRSLEHSIILLQKIESYINVNVAQNTCQKLISQQEMSNEERMTLWQSISLAFWLHRHHISTTPQFDNPGRSPKFESGAALTKHEKQHSLETIN